MLKSVNNLNHFENTHITIKPITNFTRYSPTKLRPFLF